MPEYKENIRMKIRIRKTEDKEDGIGRNINKPKLMTTSKQYSPRLIYRTNRFSNAYM